MTARERGDFAKLIRQRERVLKSKAKERSAELAAQFEQQIAAEYSFDDDETWCEAYAAAEAEVQRAQARIANRCREMGIPKAFAPSISVHWFGRGENAVKDRRAELRRVAVTQIAALERSAVSKIEAMALEAQTEIIKRGIETQAAQTFLDAMQPLEALMPDSTSARCKICSRLDSALRESPVTRR
jgi:hypothetical protein